MNPDIRRIIQTTLREAKYGSKSRVVAELAELYGYSISAIYAQAKLGKIKRKREPVKTHYRDWVKAVLPLRYSVANGRELPMDLVIEAGILAGKIPPEAAEMPVGTAYRIIRELDLRKRPSRTRKLIGDYPMQALQIDGSSSESLVVSGQLENGDYELKLHTKPTPVGGYKNKPVGADRLRVQIYGAWDMCTGYVVSRYVVERGENAYNAMDFLCYVMQQKEDKRIPICGVPDNLWTDQGPLYKSAAAADLLERLGITPIAMKPYSKTGTGGVERPHRTRWNRFEQTLFLRGKKTLTLSELNSRLREFEIKENRTRFSRSKLAGIKATRTDAWVALTNRRDKSNPLRQLPDGAIAAMAHEGRRKVDQNGIVRWRNEEYELDKIHSEWITVRQPINSSKENEIICERVNGERHVARTITRSYGEIIGSPKSELTKLLEAAEDDQSIDVDIYAPKEHEGNVHSIRPRTEKPAEFDNPFETSRYRTEKEAWDAFRNIYPLTISQKDKEAITDLFNTYNYDKVMITDLARELLTEAQTG